MTSSGSEAKFAMVVEESAASGAGPHAADEGELGQGESSSHKSICPCAVVSPVPDAALSGDVLRFPPSSD